MPAWYPPLFFLLNVALKSQRHDASGRCDLNAFPNTGYFICLRSRYAGLGVSENYLSG